MIGKLFYGDNLDVMREHIADESVDLIYLEPPFDSNAGYNVLFKSATGAGAVGAYQRSDRLAKRRELMERWQNYLLG